MNGIILAGGKSSRFGKNKAFINISGQFLIERTVVLLRQIFCKIYIVTNSPREYESLGAEIVVDIFKECGPMAGIHAGLTASDSYHNFIVACDMPYLNPELIRRLGQEVKGFDLVVPEFGGKLQMLHAFYSKNCLPVIEKRCRAGLLALRNGAATSKGLPYLQLQNLVKVLNSRVIEEESGESFMNINTRADYREALALVN